MNRIGSVACLFALAALAGCASTPAPSIRRKPPGPVCAVPPEGAGSAGAVAAEAGPRPEVLLALARQLRAAGDREGARARLEQAAVAAPDDLDVCLELADLLVSDGIDLDRARGMLEAVPADRPGRDATLGRLAELRDDPAAAEAAYGRQLAAADDPEVRLRRALALERLGRNSEAIAELERLRADAPASALVRARLAERYEAAGRVGEAEAELQALAQSTPARPEGWRRLAAFYIRHGLAENARAAEARAHDAETRPKRELRPLRPSSR